MLANTAIDDNCEQFCTRESTRRGQTEAVKERRPDGQTIATVSVFDSLTLTLTLTLSLGQCQCRVALRCAAVWCGASRRFSSSTVFVSVCLSGAGEDVDGDGDEGRDATGAVQEMRDFETRVHTYKIRQTDTHTHTDTLSHIKKMRARETWAKMRIRKCFCRPNSLIWIIYNWQTQQQTFNNNHNNSKICIITTKATCLTVDN